MSFVSCRAFENGAGSVLHITYRNDGKDFSIVAPGKALSEKSQIDKIAGLDQISELTKKITLRIAWLIHNDCSQRMKRG